ncbi:hypothetical protein HGRIS_011368 [Hohenbuehelia grisea]|uniref:Uncharacterized protein n=1 Tax=Hohenbuehelia grisea TaxID=104357 RepID=A0ABR3JX15_9AGAR
MDPLAIATALVEMALKIKCSVEKATKNRENLRQLTSHVVAGIMDIKEFCRAHQRTQDEVGAQELREALDTLSRELYLVLHHCEKITPQRPKAVFGRIKMRFLSWWDLDDLEVDILRLKVRVQECHTQFTSFSSARNEQNVLLLLHESRARSFQLDQLLTQMLLFNNTIGHKPPRAITGTAPGVEMHHYLSHKLRGALPVIDSLITTRTCWYEDPDVYHKGQLRWLVDKRQEPNTTSFNRALYTLLHIIEALERDVDRISAQRVASSLHQLAAQLVDIAQVPIGFRAYAASVASAATQIYSRLWGSNRSNQFLYYLAFALFRSSVYSEDGDDSLQTAGEAVVAWTELHGSSRSDSHAANLTNALGAYSARLSWHGRFEEALEYSREGLSVIRQVPNTSSRREQTIRWEGSGNATVVFTSRRSITRSADIAYAEVYALYCYAVILGSCGRYSEAFLTGTEAINCYQALLRSLPNSRLGTYWHARLLELQIEAPAWVSVTRCSPQLQYPVTEDKPPVQWMTGLRHASTRATTEEEFIAGRSPLD